MRKRKTVTKESAKEEFRQYYDKQRRDSIKSKIKNQNKKKKERPELEYFCSPEIEPSFAEQLIIEILIKNEIAFEREVSFTKCINPKTKYLFRFDFYLVQYNLVIEYDGAHHEDEVFVSSDGIKNSFCKTNKIRLLRLNKKVTIN